MQGDVHEGSQDSQVNDDPGCFGFVESCWREGRVEEAETRLAEILAENPKDTRSLLWLGVMLAQTGRVGEGIETLTRLVQIDVNSVEGLNWLAAMLREKGENERAAEYAARGVAIRPDADGFTNLGQCYFGAEQFEEAASAFRKVVDMMPSAQNYGNLALALDRLGREKDAEWACRKGLIHEPSDSSLNFQLGQLLLRQEESKAAVAHLRAAYAADPQCLPRVLALAQALQEENRYDEAELYAKKALDIEPNEALAFSILGAVEQYRGHFDKANEYLEKSLASDPDHIAAYFDRAFGGRVSAADTHLVDGMQRLLEMEGNDEQQVRFLHFALGKAHNDLGNYALAFSHFADANKISKAMMTKKGEIFEPTAYRRRIDLRVETFTKNFFIRHSKPILETAKPIFVLGMMRSGTTLTEQILSSHPDIGGAGELSFWNEHAKEAVDSTGRDINRRKARELGEEYLDILETTVPGAKHVVDKMPHNYLNMGLLTTIFPNAKIFLCSRNPADNCFSIFVTPFRFSAEYGHDLENIAIAYREYRRLMDHWRAVLPAGRMFEAQYEEMVADRDTMARKMIEFIGLPWNEACLHHEDNERVVTTASKWQARQPIYKTSVERWRRYEPWIQPFKDLLEELSPQPKAA